MPEEAMLRVGPTMRVEGTVKGEGPAEVHGRLSGRIALADDLYVARGGQVDGDLAARRATVDGSLRGRWRLSASIEVRAGADLVGDLATPSLSLSPEASFDGELDMPVDLPPDLLA